MYASPPTTFRRRKSTSSSPVFALGKSLPTFCAWLLLASCCFVSVTANSTPNQDKNRILVLLDDLKMTTNFSQLWEQLKDRGYDLDIKQAGDSSLALTNFGENAYDHLILFAPKAKVWGPSLEPRSVIDFVKEGGNILVSLDTGFHESWRALAYEFGVDFDDRDTLVIDHFKFDTAASNKSHTRLAVSNINPDARSVVSKHGHKKNNDAPVLYEGIAHKISNSNPLVFNVLGGEKFTYSYEAKSGGGNVGTIDMDPVIIGNEVGLVSVVQARNNARVVFAGGLKMFSNEFFSAPVQQKGSSRFDKSGNAEFVEEITKWVFQEKSVLRVVSVHHHQVGKSVQPDHYRIKDDITYKIEIQEYNSKAWKPFTSEDVQLEVRMLDPYIRRTLTPTNDSLLTTTMKLPDVYGLFTLRVNYKRPGLAYIDHSLVVPVHPFQHNDYPRFLSQAYPYYASAASMSVGFLLVCVVWMFHKEGSVESKVKKT